MKNLFLLLIPILMLASCKENNVVINAGIGGNNTYDLLNRIQKDLIEQSPDLAIIMVGTNDMLNSKKMVSYNNYRLNLEKIAGTLKNEGIHVVLCSPPTADKIYLFERHDSTLFTESPNQKLDSITQIIKDVATLNNADFIDINKIFRDKDLPQHNTDEYIQNEKNSGKRDGVHPTAAGYSLIAETVFNFLSEQNLLKPNIKIVCFGDSITFGQGVEGAGTINGDTYPAIFLQLISGKTQPA